MSSNGKRKATEDISSNEKRKATTSSTTDPANPTKSSLTHVYVVQSLDGDPYRPLEQDVRGVYTDLATANAAARDFYNKHSSWGPLAEVKRPKPEQPKMRSGRYRDMAEDEGEEENDELGCVRLRHDGGLRFGMVDPEGTQYVVWVEKRELNPAKPSPTESEEYAAANSMAYGARHQLPEGGYASGGYGRTRYGSDEFGPQHAPHSAQYSKAKQSPKDHTKDRTHNQQKEERRRYYSRCTSTGYSPQARHPLDSGVPEWVKGSESLMPI